MPPKDKGGGKKKPKGKKGPKDADQRRRSENSESSLTSDAGSDPKVVGGASVAQAGQQSSELSRALEAERSKNLELQKALDEARAAQAGSTLANRQLEQQMILNSVPRGGRVVVSADGQSCIVLPSPASQPEQDSLAAQQQALQARVANLTQEQQVIWNSARDASYTVRAPLETVATSQDVQKPVHVPQVPVSSASTSQNMEYRSPLVTASANVGYQPPPRGSREDKDMAAVRDDWYQMTLEDASMDTGQALSEQTHEVVIEGEGFSVPTFSDRDVGRPRMNEAAVKATLDAVARGNLKTLWG